MLQIRFRELHNKQGKLWELLDSILDIPLVQFLIITLIVLSMWLLVIIVSV